MPTNVTYEQAGGSGIATGISLSGKAGQYKDLYLAEQRRKQAAEAKAAEDERKAIERWGDVIDIKGVHQLDMGEAKADAAKTFNELVENYSGYSLIKKQQKLMEFKQRQMQRTARAKDLENAESQLRTIANSRSYGAEEANAALKEMTTGSWETLQGINDNRYGIFRSDAQKRSVLVNPIQNIDINAKIEAAIGSPTYATTPTGNVLERTVTDAAGNKTMQKSFEMGVGEADIQRGARDFIITDPNHRAALEYSLSKAGELPENYFALRDSEVAGERNAAGEILQRATAHIFRDKAKTRYVNLQKSTPQPKEGKTSSGIGYSDNKTGYTATKRRDDIPAPGTEEGRSAVVAAAYFSPDLLNREYDYIKITTTKGEDIRPRKLYHADPAKRKFGDIPVVVEGYIYRPDGMWIVGKTGKDYDEDTKTFKNEVGEYRIKYSDLPKNYVTGLLTPEQALEKLSGTSGTSTGSVTTSGIEKQKGPMWTYGGKTFAESEWIKAGWTVEKLKKHAKQGVSQ